MKKNDSTLLLLFVLLVLPFFINTSLLLLYNDMNKEHGLIMSFIKFAVLATFGEVLGYRIKTGGYDLADFGILPRALVWGLIGLSVKTAFTIFSTGVPAFLAYCGLTDSVAAMAPGSAITVLKIFTAFCISFVLNILFAPLMMTFHKITDAHIESYHGSIISVFKKIEFKKILFTINWDVHYGFVLMKSIPFFWIPAHTITFLLPPQHQVLFAAFLGVMLGVILSVAAVSGKKR
ncbi:MAG: Mpv17/PMP22 family protein [Bacteroidetes bacterium]|nr:Mpv17/PMP22 family protein [Bacteroidota bacterium]